LNQTPTDQDPFHPSPLSVHPCLSAFTIGASTATPERVTEAFASPFNTPDLPASRPGVFFFALLEG